MSSVLVIIFVFFFCWNLANENISYLLRMVTTKNFLSYIIGTLLLQALATKDTNSPSRRCLQFRLRVVLHFSSGIVERAKRERAITACVGLFSRALALLSLRKNGGLLVVYLQLSRIIKRGDSLCSTVASVERGKGWLGKMGEELGREEKGLLPFRFAFFSLPPPPLRLLYRIGVDRVEENWDELNKAC